MALHSMLPERFAEAVRRSPEAVAVGGPGTGLSYRDLDRAAGRLARALAAAGAGEGDLVGVRLEAQADYLVAILGIWRAGAAVVQLSPHALLDEVPAEVPVVVTTAAPAAAGLGRAVRFIRLDSADLDAADLDSEPGADAADLRPRAAVPDAAAWVSRAADAGGWLILDHATLANQVAWFVDRHDVTEKDRVLCAGPLGAVSWPMLAALVQGATVLSAPEAPAGGPARPAFDPEATVAVAESQWLAAARENWPDCPGLRLVLMVGTSAPREVCQWLAARTMADLLTLYTLGDTLVVAADECDVLRDTASEILGRPIDNVRALVLDEFGDPLPPGIPGDLHLAGAAVARGFLGDIRGTAENFPPDLFSRTGGRMYRTGDFVRWRKDGTLERLPRREDGHAAAGRPTAAGGLARPDYTEPATDAERTVASVWADLLETPRVGRDDNFFQLGGYSLLITELAKRLQEASGAQIVLGDLFMAATVREQAALLDASGPGTAAAPGIAPVRRGEPLPLSSGQRRIWLLDNVDPSPEWIAPVILQLAEEVTPDQARRILDRLAERHESLRTRYVAVDGEPMQIVGDVVPIELRTFEGTRDAVVEAFQSQFELQFDLASGRLWRATLARDTAAPGRLLLITIHHIASDGWSASILEEEFRLLLAAELTGRGAQLPGTGAQYADFAVWQREQDAGEGPEGDLVFWRRALDGALPLQLPTDRPRPAKRDHRGSVVTFTIPRHLAEALRQLGKRHDATPFATLLAAYSALLARYSGQWDVLVGTPVVGRTRPEFRRTVGFFLNTLVLRCGLDGGLEFSAALGRVRDVCRSAFAHQGLSFERIVDELSPDRDPSRTPVYQVALNYHDDQLIGGMPSRADIDYLASARRVAKTDLTLYIRNETDGTWTGAFEYATALFDQSTVQRMAEHFVRFLEAVAADPRLRLSEVDILSEPERTGLLETWASGEPVDWPAGSTLDVIEAQAAATPDAAAVVCGDRVLSYRGLDEWANQIAGRLIAGGVLPWSVVGVCLPRGLALVPALLGVWKAGAAYLPADPSTPPARLGSMFTDAAVRVAVGDSSTSALLGGSGFEGTRVLIDEPGIGAEPDGRPRSAPARSAGPDDLAYVIYTSGSTGVPKGVMVHHRGLANHLRWAARDLDAASGAALFSSVAFDLPATNVFAPLMCGGAVRVVPAEVELSGLGAALAAGAPYGFLKLTPGHLEVLTEQLDPTRAAALAKIVLVAGEALPVRLAARWLDLLGPGRLVNEYGPTENSIGSTVFPVSAPPAGGVPLGRTLPNVTGYVVSQDLRPAPLGVAGEFCVGGHGVAHGYLGRPALTAERFIPDPFGAPGARLYRSGDLVRRLPVGDIEFLGRIDDQVKIRGYRVEPGEIQARLRECAGVRDACVLAGLDSAGQRSLTAYAVPAAGALEISALRNELAAALPDYMIPAAIIVLDEIPLTANGKVDRAALPDPEAAATAHVPPETYAEERVCEVWQGLLGLDQVSVEESFFELGGHSILAIRLVARLNEEFDIDVSIATVFGNPTVRRLAAAIEELIMAEIGELSDSEVAEWGAGSHG